MDIRRLLGDLTRAPALAQPDPQGTFGSLSPYTPPRTERTYNAVKDVTGDPVLANAASFLDMGGATLDLGQQSAEAAQAGNYGTAAGLGALGLAGVLPIPAAKVAKGVKKVADKTGLTKEVLSLAPEVLAANRTARASGAVGSKAITPRYISETVTPNETVLNFGAGKPGKGGVYGHSETIRQAQPSATVREYDFGQNAVGAIEPSDTVFASNVLNVQSGPDMMRDTLNQIKGAAGRRAVFNLPQSPNKHGMKPEEVESLVTEVFGIAPTRVGGTKSAPLWEVQMPQQAAPSVQVPGGAGAPPSAPGSLAVPTEFPLPTLASTRLPTGAKSTVDPLKTPVLSGDMDAFLQNPTADFNVGLMQQYPGFSFMRGMPTADAADAAATRIADNLEYLHARAPKIMQERSPEWYVGAGRFSENLANKYGVPKQNMSAAIAALSPQKDWFQNASMAERVADTMFRQQNSPWTSEMTETMKRIFPAKDTAVGRANQEMARRISGKKLSELTDPTEKAMWIRAYDETYNPRHYRSMTPEGDLGDFVKTGSGAERRTAWGSLNEIGKAVRALESDGSMQMLSPLLGSRHKVRNFYNNIQHADVPWGVTADTHQVAAGTLMPLAGGDTAVMHNLATGPASVAKRPENWQAAKSSAISGFQGTYPVFEEGTRRASERIGLLPHKTQSVTWEPVRELFQDKWKTAGNKQAVEAIWRAVDAGDITPAQARDRIFELAGGIGEPQWAGSKTMLDPANTSSFR